MNKQMKYLLIISALYIISLFIFGKNGICAIFYLVGLFFLCLQARREYKAKDKADMSQFSLRHHIEVRRKYHESE